MSLQTRSPSLVRVLIVLAAAAWGGVMPAGCAQAADTPVKPAGKNPFPGRLVAPNFDGGVEWLNTTSDVALADLRGKVVLLDFWTYCCINCMHILPDLKFLEQKYPNELVVVGVHSAKFENEKGTDNIREAILRYEIEHPVVNDANMVLWQKFNVHSWPTLVLIDPEGKYVGFVSGEGHREDLDDVIGKVAAWHRANGTLDETPIRFDLERNRDQIEPLRYPGKIVADEASDRLYISDSNHNRIVVATLDGKLIDVIGKGSIGKADGGYAEAEFDHPQGMALVGDKLYVADTENHLLRTVDLKGKQVKTLAGTGLQSQRKVNSSSLKTGLNSPWDLTVLNGTLYIAMAGPHQIWKHRLGGATIDPFAGTGREDILDGPLLQAALAQPSGITHDGKNLYHVDSEGSAVRRDTIGAGATVTTLVGAHDLDRGQSLFAFGDVDGVGDAARLQHPLGILHHNGELFVADTYNHKIKRVDIEKRTCTTWLGTGKRGTGLSPVELNEPAGLALARGKLYIADTNNHRILTADLATKEVKELPIEGLTPPVSSSK